MEKESLFFFLCFLSLLSTLPPPAAAAKGNPGIRRGQLKLFVFGDSYADAGNRPSDESISWKWPYGMTFPGRPSGRFSDGRVFADYIAKFIGIKSPLPYNLIKSFNTSSTRYGINFAHGGTGVFRTMVNYPNMSNQIDFFQEIIDKKVYTCRNLSKSIALVSVAGNDYATFLAKNGNTKDLSKFSKLVINQLMINVKRIKGFGVKKIIVAGLHPLGCLPINTVSNSYKNCNADQNEFSKLHNRLLKQNMQTLNGEASTPIFVYLNFYSAFISALKIQQDSSSGNSTEKLKPCCVGNKGGECGLFDKAGNALFTVCKKPNSSIFWDSIHPSDAGWRAVYSSLKHYLQDMH